MRSYLGRLGRSDEDLSLENVGISTRSNVFHLHTSKGAMVYFDLI